MSKSAKRDAVQRLGYLEYPSYEFMKEISVSIEIMCVVVEKKNVIRGEGSNRFYGAGKMTQVNIEIVRCYDRSSAGESDSKPGSNIFEE